MKKLEEYTVAEKIDMFNKGYQLCSEIFEGYGEEETDYQGSLEEVVELFLSPTQEDWNRINNQI